MRTPYLLLLIPVLAACGSAPTWQKSGASETAVNEDLQQCRVQAALKPDPSLLAAPSPQSTSTPLIDRGQERDSSEEQRIRQCMQSKGYSLSR